MSFTGIVQGFKIIVLRTFKLHSTGLQQGAFLAVDKNKITMYDTSNHNEHINIRNGNNIVIRPFGLVISFKKLLLASSRCS